MRSPVVIVGMGEIGGVFARGILRLGLPVYPVTRAMDMNTVATALPKPTAVVIAVAESDLHEVLATIPAVWRNQLILLQNELLPQDWAGAGIDDVTVISVWFEKKTGRDTKVIIPSPVFGPHAGLIHDALATLGIPVSVLSSGEDLLRELVGKNLYILTTNIAGLQVAGDVGQLWSQHEDLARQVANEVLDIQSWLIGQEIDRDSLIQGMLRAFEGDPAHQCMGRSAAARLRRAIAIADEAGLAVPKLTEIQRECATER